MTPELASWAQLVAQLGFPIMVAGYLLIRFDGLIVKLLAAEATEIAMLTELKDAIHGLKDAVNGNRVRFRDR